jgi:hypothetical protein
LHVHYLTDTPLSAKAEELVQFDVDSIRQVATGAHAVPPTIYLADPEQYEKNGRILRDSTSHRLLAYSPQDAVLYANDGCNSCTHGLTSDLKSLAPEQRRAFARDNSLREDLLDKLAELISAP